MYCLNGEKLFKRTCCDHSATTLNPGIHKAHTQISKFQIFLKLKKTPEANSSTKKFFFLLPFYFHLECNLP